MPSQPLLHLPTLLAMTVVGSLVMAAGLLLVGARRRGEGQGLWATALLMQSLAYVLLALRGRIPDMLSIVVANGLLAGVFASLLAAVYQFQRRPLPWRQIVPPVLVTLALFAAFREDYAARLVLAGVIYTGQLGLVLWALRQHPSEGRGARMVAIGIWLQCGMLVVRAVAAATGHMPTAGLLEESLWQHATFLTTFVTVQASSFGFIFMARDRADAINQRMAARDPLTDVPNRRATIAALDRDIGRAVRSREPLSLMMVDIDHFKRVNDELGHLAGDEVLRGVVDLMGTRVRAQDLIGRYGGEEFVVLLPDTPLDGAQRLAADLCAAVERTTFDTAAGPVRVTLSIGVFGGRLDAEDHWDALIAAADRAMYDAKHGGRNRVVVADMPLGAVARGAGPRDNPVDG
ncbi:diguanylate cyclase [Acidovorax sp. PRC11]|uniref:GGDEF domain-containing protein n=1 Tax=Acidovorax sp. PRC11 TaxID=2962592 RepID=UPI0028828BD3|nr:diguanylate cyclase [Acidovorax sp. PRC11]MDT0136654.1 diguanylate cyclase [Acidovorax sp. PRC11]